MKGSRQFGLASLATLAVALAGGAIAQQQQAPAALVDGPAPARPAFGTFGFDETGMDRSVAPGDDFYAFANGNWAKTTAIPADKSSFGAFEVLQDLSDQRTNGLLETAAKTPASKIGRAYATY